MIDCVKGTVEEKFELGWYNGMLGHRDSVEVYNDAFRYWIDADELLEIANWEDEAFLLIDGKGHEKVNCLWHFIPNADRVFSLDDLGTYDSLYPYYGDAVVLGPKNEYGEYTSCELPLEEVSSRCLFPYYRRRNPPGASEESRINMNIREKNFYREALEAQGYKFPDW